MSQALSALSGAVQIPDSLSGLLGPTSCCWYRLQDPLQIQKRPTDLSSFWWMAVDIYVSFHGCMLASWRLELGSGSCQKSC